MAAFGCSVLLGCAGGSGLLHLAWSSGPSAACSVAQASACALICW